MRMYLSVALCLVLPFLSFGQVPFRVCSYNVLNFSDDDNDRLPYLKTVLDEVCPDILLVQEVLNEAGCESLLTVLGPDFGMADFIDGYDTDNQLFYRASKVTLVSQDTIQTALRDISEYVVFVGKNYIGNEVRLYTCHLKASSGSTNEQKRLAEVTRLREHIAALSDSSEWIICGDMNFYDSGEPGYLKFMAEEGDNARSEDLIGPGGVGYWHANNTYAWTHTQSPRTTQFGGGASGGLDDRFDQIYATYGLNDIDGIEFVGNYTAFGNDGNHLDDDINDQPNTAVTPEVADALYYATDHLPVYADFESLTCFSYDLSGRGIEEAEHKEGTRMGHRAVR